MIKKLIISFGVLLMPIVAMAAYDSVSLGTSAVIAIQDSLDNTISLTVSGSADVVESIVVSSTSFAATLQSGSTLTVASAGRNAFITGASTANYSTTCETGQSSLTMTATAEVTVTISVSANACGSVGSTSSSSGGNGPIAQSGGGGGGGSNVGSAVSTTATANTTGQAQVDALKATLAALQAQVGAKPAGAGKGFAFGRALSLGVKHADVVNVQKTLNSDSDTQVAVSGAGSPGKETTLFGPATLKALKKFQVKHGLAKVNGVGYGVFGPKTKAKLSAVSQLKGL